MVDLAQKFLHSMRRLQKVVHRKESNVQQEKQDFEMEFLATKNKELDSQVSGLQWSLAEVEERREEEVGELTSKLAVLTSTGDSGEMDSAAIRLQVQNQLANQNNF